MYQDIEYTYDREGNILKRENDNFHTDDEEAKRSTQTYAYDDLHRLVGSEGSYSKESWLPFFQERLNTYENSFTYSDTGRMLRKEQVNSATYPDGETVELSPTTYSFDYEYTSHRPNAVTQAGPRTFTYDPSGNMTSMTDSSNGFTRELHWDEENRLQKTVDSIETEGEDENEDEEDSNITTGTTTYSYDPDGNRIVKSGKFGEAIYVNPNYSVRNGEVISKHIFAGNNRIASKLEMEDEQGNVDETGIYFVHPDHLGSSSVITAKDGGFHESLEYFPYGETWVHNKSSETGYTTPYKFTSKELDPETGLYYHGARYREARLGVWMSIDPILNEYLPTGDKERDKNLPGIGGVFNSVNLNLYHYAFNNPIIAVDPDGNHGFIVGIPGNRYRYMGKNMNTGSWKKYDFDGKVLSVNQDTGKITGTINLWKIGSDGGRNQYSWSAKSDKSDSIYTLAWNKAADRESGKKHSAFMVRIDEIKEDISDRFAPNEGRLISGHYWEIDPKTGKTMGNGTAFTDTYIKRDGEGVTNKTNGFLFITGVKKDDSDHEKHNAVVKNIIQYFTPNDPNGEGRIE